jgi:hypothetical protein
LPENYPRIKKNSGCWKFFGKNQVFLLFLGKTLAKTGKTDIFVRLMSH